MDVGVAIPTCKEGLSSPVGFARPDQVIEVIVHAERLGYHSVWGNDHITAPQYVREHYPDPPSFYEPLIALAAAAGVTRRIRLATATIVLPLREPVYLAKQIATLDRFSGGRVILGVGMGAYREEFERLFPRLRAARRADMAEESLTILRRLFTERPVSYDGRYYAFDGLDLAPMPLQRPLPIFVGGNHPAVVERAARHGEGWLPASMSRETLVRGATPREAAREADRDPRDRGRPAADLRDRPEPRGRSREVPRELDVPASALSHGLDPARPEPRAPGGVQPGRLAGRADRADRAPARGGGHDARGDELRGQPGRGVARRHAALRRGGAPGPRCPEGLSAAARPRLLAAHPPARLVEIVQLAEALGFESFWHGNEKYYRDPWIGLAVAAVHTRRIELGTFIQDPYTQHPALIAVAIATLDELSGGRARLMLGAGGGGGQALAYERRRPVVALREAIQVIRGLLRGERVHLDGEIVRFLGGQLNFPARPDLPIYVSSRGNLVLRMAGEMADGVMIATYATPPGVRHALGRIDEGLRRSGRTRQDLRLISRVDTCIHPDRRRARNTVRTALAGFLTTSYPDMGFVRAVGLELSPELQAVLARKDREHATPRPPGAGRGGGRLHVDRERRGSGPADRPRGRAGHPGHHRPAHTPRGPTSGTACGPWPRRSGPS
jgi:probable F420-dependent oxidoreductase